MPDPTSHRVATPIDQALLNDITRRIVERFHPRRVLLFGSHARGTAHADSDVDLFVEMESSKSPPERAIDIDALFGLRTWPMDLVVLTPDEVLRLRRRTGTILQEIEAEGRVLYERA